MSILSTDSSGLVTNSKFLTRTKYFPLEIKVVGVKPLTNFNALYNGTNVNSFCKPFGAALGAQITSDTTGKILFQLMISIPYNQTYLINSSDSSSSSNTVSFSRNSSSLQLQDPTGAMVSTYLPINLKM